MSEKPKPTMGIGLHLDVRLRPMAVLLATAGLLSLPTFAQTALPSGGTVSAGSATISQAGAAMRIDQSSQKTIIDWNSFNIGRDAAVRFNQPNSSAIALNRVGADGGRSVIDGQLSANGQVWLLNPGGALFGPSARIEVGGLLSSSMKIGNDNFLNGNYHFTQDGAGRIVNQGQLNATEGGYIALMAPEVRNEGVITARLGTVALASGNELRLDLAGDRLIELAIDQAAVNSLVENKHLIQADGGAVLMSTDALNRLALGAVNNSGIVRAQTIAEHDGVIRLLGGTTTVSGTLDASAPNGGNGGFIETSGHSVTMDPTLKVTTAAMTGKTGNWLIDPVDYLIAPSGGDITGFALSSNLNNTNVTISTAALDTPYGGGFGDIFVNDAVSWNSGNTLSLLAERNIEINNTITGSNPASQFQATAPGILTVAGSGSVSAGSVTYRANDMQLSGSTNHALTTNFLTVAPHTDSGGVQIGASSSPGLLNLTPSEIGTLHATNISIATTNGEIRVTAALNPEHIAAQQEFVLNGRNINVDAAVNAPGKNLLLMSPGTLTVSAAGSVSGSSVTYWVNDATLVGHTTGSSTRAVQLGPNTSGRSIRIDTNSAAGALNLSPAEIGTLTAADSSAEVHIGGEIGNPAYVSSITVAAPLAASNINSNLYLIANSIAVNSSIDASSGAARLGFVSGTGGTTLNAAVTTPNEISVILGSGGGFNQTTNGLVTAHVLKARGTGAVTLDENNTVAAVAANVSGSFWLNNGMTPLSVISRGSAEGTINGITANNIGLVTSNTLTLDAPLTATSTGAVSSSGVTVTDTLCTGTCVRPHIELYAHDGFTNNVGASALSLPPGKYWMLTTESPAVTTLNGLQPGATSFDAQRTEDGDMLLSANRLFHYLGATSATVEQVVASQETTTPDVGTTTPAPAAVEPAGGTGSGGATLNTFPTSAPVVTSLPGITTQSSLTPSLIVNASRSMPTRAGILNRTDLAALNQQMHDTRTQLFSEALQILASNPKAADVPDCGEGGSEVCIVKRDRGVAEFVPIVKRKIALVIGNNSYRSPIPELETAINDVTAIGEELGARLGYEVKVVQDAGRKETIDALNDLIRTTGPDDSVLVMYAGHGYLDEKTGAGYWIPTDANAFKPDQWISNDSIARALNNIPAKQVMLVSDSCYSGSLTKEGKQTEIVGISRDQTLTRRSVLAMSSGGEEPVSDEGVDNHSIFAWNFLQSIKTMTNETSGQKLHAVVKEAVTKDFPQVPQYGTVVSAGHTEGGEYLLTPKAPTQGGAR